MRLPSFLFYFMEQHSRYVSSCGTQELRIYYDPCPLDPRKEFDNFSEEEVKAYLEGEVFGYRIFDRTKQLVVGIDHITKDFTDLSVFEVDSCWGYYGDSGFDQILEETCPEDQIWIEQ